jgi:hypothetical protein
VQQGQRFQSRTAGSSRPIPVGECVGKVVPNRSFTSCGMPPTLSREPAATLTHDHLASGASHICAAIWLIAACV